MEYDSHEATASLGISPETLRDWSERFGSFLSSTAQPQSTGRTNGTEQRYTENDIALLGQIKALLNNGHTYEQAQAMLNNSQPDNLPQRTPRRPARQKAEAQALTSTASMSKELGAPQPTSEQTIATKDQQITELEQMLQVALLENNQRVLAATEQQAVEFEAMIQAAQRQIEQLQAENQTLRERLDQAETAYAPSYSFQLKVLLIMVVVAVLITILIEFVFKS